VLALNQKKSIIKVLLLVLTFSMVFSFINTASAPPEDINLNQPQTSQDDATTSDESQNTQNNTDVALDESQTTPQDNTSAIDESQTAAEDDTNITPSDIIIAQAEPGLHGEIIELTPVGAPYNELGPIRFRCTVNNTGTDTIYSWLGSRLRLRIYDPDGNLLDSVTYTVPTLTSEQSYTFTWDTTNEDFPEISDGYTITATWVYYWGLTTLDTESTTFYSVPSPWLIVVMSGFLMAIAVLARKKRWWLSFYLAGAVALVALLISFFLLTGYDTYIMGIEAGNIAYIASALGIPSNFIPPNAFIFPDPTGWSIFGIGFECSSLIEISVLVGLLLLYPGYSFKRKMKYAGIGIVATYGANLIRMLSIILIVNVFGKSTLYFAHAFIGKIIFFAFVIVLYWYLLTRPTLNIVRSNIKAGKFEF